MIKNNNKQSDDFKLGDMVIAKTKYNDIFIKHGIIIDIKNTNISTKELFVMCIESGWSSWVKSEKCNIINAKVIEEQTAAEASAH